jgi:hypothetical protein
MFTSLEFNSKDAILSESDSDNDEIASTKSNNDFKLIGDFVKISYILGLSRITQNIGTSVDDGSGGTVVRYDRETGYNAVFGIDMLPMKSSYLHFVPLRTIITLGKSGTCVFVSTEVGLSFPNF